MMILVILFERNFIDETNLDHFSNPGVLFWDTILCATSKKNFASPLNLLVHFWNDPRIAIKSLLIKIQLYFPDYCPICVYKFSVSVSKYI